MKNFSDMGIKPTPPNFTGDSIKIDRILNKEVNVLAFKTGPSSKKPGTEYLTLQLEVDGAKRVLFSGSKTLIDMIQKVQTGDIPFKTTIIKESESYQFT